MSKRKKTLLVVIAFLAVTGVFAVWQIRLLRKPAEHSVQPSGPKPFTDEAWAEFKIKNPPVTVVGNITAAEQKTMQRWDRQIFLQRELAKSLAPRVGTSITIDKLDEREREALRESLWFIDTQGGINSPPLDEYSLGPDSVLTVQRSAAGYVSFDVRTSPSKNYTFGGR